MPYVYQADIICDKCREKIEVPRPDYPEPWGTDDFPSYTPDGGETDSPCHCGDCGEPIECSLTEDGVQYVLDEIQSSMEEALAKGRAETWDRIMPMPGTGEESMVYWHGSRHVEIVRSWAEDLRNYSLGRPGERAIVDLFLDLSEAPR